MTTAQDGEWLAAEIVAAPTFPSQEATDVRSSKAARTSSDVDSLSHQVEETQRAMDAAVKGLQSQVATISTGLQSPSGTVTTSFAAIF
eukprot:6078256-Pyramimonas_sp.AAC.1